MGLKNGQRVTKMCTNNVDILPNTYNVPNWWFQAKSLLFLVVEWGKEISLSGKILNCRKIQTIFRLNFFPLIFFFTKMTYHRFKACSRMVKSNILIVFKHWQNFQPKISCSNFSPDPFLAFRFGIRGEVELSSN